jgi:hypothetical protein
LYLLISAESLTPYILFALGGVIGFSAWLAKRSIAHGEAIVKIEAALEYYFETKAKAAARVLDSPNPTPLEMRLLFRKYTEGRITETEKNELREWLKRLLKDPGTPKDEYLMAMDFVSATGALKRMKLHERD